jgi:inosine/xanthosine triphosphatase
MKINVGSKNKTKVQAVEDAVKLYPHLFPNPEIVGIDVNVPLFGHPKSIKETVEGAVARAKEAFNGCDYSFGIEGGLMEVPYTKTGFMEVGACAINDGKNIHLGLGPGYEWPPEVTHLILSGKADASQAFKQLGLTYQEKLGAVEGRSRRYIR